MPRAAIVADHLDLMNNFLHHHHTGEDRLLWPKLLQRVPADVAPIVELMESQHEKIHQAMESIKTPLARWRREATVADRDAVADGCTELHARLDEHLAAEEEHILPLASQCLSHAEWAQLGEDGMSSLQKRYLPLVLGMFMYEGDPAVLAKMLSAAPLPVRLVMPRIAPGTYRRYARRVHGTGTPA